MVYLFDTNSLSVIFRHYYYERFPSFWEKFDSFKEKGKIISVRETRKEIEIIKRGDRLEDWIKQNSDFFKDPTIEELKFITTIYSVNHFQHNLEKTKLLNGGAFADPFIIAKARVNNAIVVTQEKRKENGAKIPNICEYFGIECIDLNGFLVKENWIF